MVTHSGSEETTHTQSDSFAAEEIERYSRHFLLPQIGKEGQRKLKSSRVLLIGAGGLGSPAALYLAAAGVGTLGVVDFDRVELTNLQRQIIHRTRDVGRSKTESAEERIHEINPHVIVEPYDLRLSAENALEILRAFDVIVDGSDNFATRYLVNDAAVLLGKPDVYGSIHRFEGQASVFAAPGGPCYRCLFREPPPPGLVPNCAEAGVLGVLPGLVGTIQATEAIKLLLSIGKPLVGRLLLIDSLEMSFRTITVDRDPACPSCGPTRSQTLTDYEIVCEVDTSHASAQANGAFPEVALVTPVELSSRLLQGEDIDVVDVREEIEWDIARIPNARLVPLSRFDSSLASFDPGRPTVLYCKVGVRSLRAAEHLAAAGFPNVASLAGGIDRWRDEVDPELPSY